MRPVVAGRALIKFKLPKARARAHLVFLEADMERAKSKRQNNKTDRSCLHYPGALHILTSSSKVFVPTERMHR